MLKRKGLFTGLIAAIAAAGTIVAGPAGAKVDGDTIVLGAAVSLTGKYSTEGVLTKNGYDLAVKRLNAMGGVKVGGKTYKMSVKYYDDESDSTRAAQLMERLISQDKVTFVLGPYGSGLTVAIAPVVEKHKIPMIEANGATRSLFNKGYRYTFAVLSTSDQYLSVAIDLAAEKVKAMGRDPKSLKVAIAIENDPFSGDVRAGVVDAAKKYGMKIVIDDKLPPDISDMSTTLTKAKALRPDLLIVSGHAKGAALVTRQIGEMKVNVPMLAITHCDSARIEDQKKFGKNAENTLCAAQWDGSMTYKDKWFGTAGDYVATYKKAHGRNPPYQAAESTAGVLVYAEAIRRAGSFDKEKVRNAIASTDMMTFYGPIKFDTTGKNIAKPMVLLQIQKGKYVTVAPSKFAAGKLVYPRPKW